MSDTTPKQDAGALEPSAGKEWYASGLSFSCTQCGNCCTGEPGYVWFTRREGNAMAEYLKLELSTFLRQFARTINGHWTLTERRTPEGQYDCVFLQRDATTGKALCGIYPVRPKQCRTWPFWPDNLASPSAWKRAATKCPGIDKGTFYPIDQVRIIRDSNP